jgi:hypothetical protein
MNILLSEGTSVVFLRGIGYKNEKGQVKYDVKAGARGIIKRAKLSNGKTFYDIELAVGKTLTNDTVVKDVEDDFICESRVDLIKPVDEFPKKPKKNRPWRKFNNEQLEAFAIKHGVEWRKNDNPKVNRMFLVKALDDSGLDAPENEEELQQRIG